MTAVLGQQGDGGGLDMIAVNRDADLLDLLARRAPVPAGDPVLALLAALAADVDEGLDEMLVAIDDEPLVRAASAATVVPDLPAPRRGHGLRATTIAIVVGTTLSIGGVAAAVTGDPLAPVKGFATAVGIRADKHEAGQGAGKAGTAEKHARSRLAHGDLAGARAGLAEMRAQLQRGDLSHGERQSIQARVDALQKQVDRAVAALGAEAQDKGKGGGNAGGGSGTGTGTGKDEAAPGKDKTSDGRSSDGKGVPATPGKPSSKPAATRTAEPGEQQKKADATGGNARPTQAAASGNRSRQASPSASDDSEDAPATTATAETTRSTGGGKPVGTGSGHTDGPKGASSGR